MTGAGEGIDARTAELLTEAGASVVVTGRTDGPCKVVVERIRASGHDACFRHLDVAREDDWHAFSTMSVRASAGSTCW